MKISIIVPVYNIENYLPKCIESLLSQTYANWEAILVDDGSSDNSGTICDKYSNLDSRIKVIHKENEGVVSARIDGVKSSEGEFIYFLDGDDYIAPDALSLFVTKQKESAADIVIGGFRTVTDDLDCKNGDDFIFPHFTNSYDLLQFRFKTSVWAVWNILFKKNILLNSLTQNRELVIGEDLVLNLKISLITKQIASLQDITYFYLVRESSATQVTQNNLTLRASRYIPMIEEMDKLLDVYKEQNIPNSIIRLMEFKIVNILCKEIIPYEEVFKKNKEKLLLLYKKYFSKNFGIQIKVFKRSPRRYFRYWSIIKKFK
ncbi:MAG: glycosyltransferase family 2 protein [Bacteroidaceae bacterium]|nr:glycosyltransferase family 2 protein [Bacteroidaceae bacterium]